MYCHRNTVNQRINPSTSVFEALQNFTRDQKRALLSWLTKQGPFWEEVPSHHPDLWLECGDEIVTETAVGEAAYCAISGIDRQLVSFCPSSWQYSPIPVTLVTSSRTTAEVVNWWDGTELTIALRKAAPPITSWGQLETFLMGRYQHLKFSHESFAPLGGRPFVHAAAYRIIGLMDTLDRLQGCFDDAGRRTPEGQQLYQDHFTRGNAWFSDSSDTEKNDFRDSLTFPDPDVLGQHLFCTWHGKVRTEFMRVHFSWPVPAGSTIYVAYIGPKITKT